MELTWSPFSDLEGGWRFGFPPFSEMSTTFRPRSTSSRPTTIDRHGRSAG
jgi:hypothetical protein